MLIRLLALTLALTALAALGFATLAIHKNGLAPEEIDLDGDGRTSLSELFEAVDTGVRPTVQDGLDCP